MAKLKYVYKLKSDNKLSQFTARFINTLINGEIKSVNITVDVTPTPEKLYFGVIEMNDKPVCGECGYSREEVFSSMNKWLDENFELKEVFE